MFFETHQDEIFQETFDRVYYDLRYRYENDPHYTFQYFKDFLDSMYTFEGQDLFGRGEIKHLKNMATTSALQTILLEIESGTLKKKTGVDDNTQQISIG